MAENVEELSSDEYFMLWVLIAQTRDGILRARERDYARYGISNERRAVLYMIENNGGSATPVEIARDLFRELHSITEMLKRMEKDGLIERYKGTGRSKDIFNQSLHIETDERVFSVLSAKERKNLASTLFKLRSRVLEDLGIPEWHLNFPLLPQRPEE